MYNFQNHTVLCLNKALFFLLINYDICEGWSLWIFLNLTASTILRTNFFFLLYRTQHLEMRKSLTTTVWFRNICNVSIWFHLWICVAKNVAEKNVFGFANTVVIILIQWQFFLSSFQMAMFIFSFQFQIIFCCWKDHLFAALRAA